MKYLLISLFVIVGVGSTEQNKSIQLDNSKSDVSDIDINNVTYPSVPITEINSPTDAVSTDPSTTKSSSTIAPSSSTTPNITTSSSTTTVPTSSTTTTSVKPPNVTTTYPPSTVKPSVPTTAPVPEHHRRFDGPSFVGGIVLALGLVAIGFVAFKFYKARTELNYHTL